MAVGKAGAKNAAYLAAEILAVSDPALKEKLLADRKAGAEKVVAKDAALRPKLVHALSKALAAVGPLHVWTTVAAEVAATDGDGCNTATRNASLKELFLARALVRCGDDAKKSGAAALRAYAGDVRGQFAASASAAMSAI